VFQRHIVKRCGTAFVRIMEGTVRTDAEVAALILKAKGFKSFLIKN
jgi:hypothetical protein